jgi:hypothetical protein
MAGSSVGRVGGVERICGLANGRGLGRADPVTRGGSAAPSLIGRPVGDHGSSAEDTYCPVSTCPDFRVNVYRMGELAGLSFVAGAGLPVRHVS